MTGTLITVPQPAPLRYVVIAEGSVVTDGTEQTILLDAPPKTCIVGGFLDLTPMVLGDVIVVREYEKINPVGAYVKYATRTYGLQSDPLLFIHTRPLRYGVRITVQRTAGADYTYDYLFMRYQ